MNAVREALERAQNEPASKMLREIEAAKMAEQFDWTLARLITVAGAYAKAKNLEPVAYVSAMLESIVRSATDDQAVVQIRYLIRYHDQWLKDCK